MNKAAALGAGMAMTMLATGCVERLIYDHVCGNGIVTPGELCLGLGDRREVVVDTLAPLSLRTGDFNGDLNADLMVLGTEPSGIVAARLWLGDGDGGLSPPLDPGVGGCSAHPVAGSLGDDTADDLLVDDCGPSVSLFRGTSSGTFQSALTVVTGVATHGSGMIDLDDDGLHDVVIFGSLPEDQGGLALAVAQQTSPGVFRPPSISNVEGGPLGLEPNGWSMLDYDGDPHRDVMLVQSDLPGGIAISRGLDNFNFSAPEPVGPPGLQVSWAAVRDLDGDGTEEVLAASYDAQALIVLDFDDGLLVERRRSSIPGLQPSPIALDDVDGNGTLDLVRVESGVTNLDVWQGQEDGRFTGPTSIDLDAPIDQLALTDLDNDGVLDIVAGSFGESRVRVLLSDP
ncbi:MAG: VCBS repeat-containing protein [Myxococcota bacterium]